MEIIKTDGAVVVSLCKDECEALTADGKGENERELIAAALPYVRCAGLSEDEKVYCEIFLSHGGCEMFFKRKDDIESKECGVRYIQEEDTGDIFGIADSFVYEFERFENFLGCCRALSLVSADGELFSNGTLAYIKLASSSTLPGEFFGRSLDTVEARQALERCRKISGGLDEIGSLAI